MLNSRKIAAILLPLTALAFLLLVGGYLRSLPLETLALCAADRGGIVVPAPVCRAWFPHGVSRSGPHQRSEALHFILKAYDSGRSQQHNDQLLDLSRKLIGEGAELDRVSAADGYTPLTAAVLRNEPALVDFLLRQGASPAVRDQRHELVPLALARMLNEARPGSPWQAIIQRLSP